MNDKGRHVLIVGGGFAGLGCAQGLAGHDGVNVTLIDRNNYHQFQPLLYQVATSQLAPSDIANSLRAVFADDDDVDVKLAEIAEVDPATRTITSADGQRWSGDVLVLAAGSQPNFFDTPGAADHAFPLYSLDHATNLRSRILGLFEQVDRDPRLDRARGAELRDRRWRTHRRRGGGRDRRHGQGDGPGRVPRPGRERGEGPSARLWRRSAQAVLRQRPRLRGEGAGGEGGADPPGHRGQGGRQRSRGVLGRHDVATRCVVWGGGIKAAGVAADAGLAQGRGGRVDVEHDLTLAGHDGVYVIGDIANIPDGDDRALPQLGSVALQSGAWAAKNILADLAGKPREPFAYHDKGIMAMIGRGAAIAEVGKRHHEIHGEMAHMAWLGVHASLMTGTKAKIEAFVDWAWDGFSKTGGPHVLDRGDAAEIDWDDDAVVAPPGTSAPAH